MRLTKSESKGCVSLFSRFDITIEQVTKLSISAREYYRVNALFLPTSVNPTVWTIGHIIPAHTKQKKLVPLMKNVHSVVIQL